MMSSGKFGFPEHLFCWTSYPEIQLSNLPQILTAYIRHIKESVSKFSTKSNGLNERKSKSNSPVQYRQIFLSLSSSDLYIGRSNGPNWLKFKPWTEDTEANQFIKFQYNPTVNKRENGNRSILFCSGRFWRFPAVELWSGGASAQQWWGTAVVLHISNRSSEDAQWS